jgi:hypothetical protein
MSSSQDQNVSVWDQIKHPPHYVYIVAPVVTLVIVVVIVVVVLVVQSKRIKAAQERVEKQQGDRQQLLELGA